MPWHTNSIFIIFPEFIQTVNKDLFRDGDHLVRTFSFNTKKMVISFLLLVVYVLLLKYLGFAVSSVLYLGANLWILKNPPLRTIITVAVILLALLFGAPQLGISLPRGMLGF